MTARDNTASRRQGFGDVPFATGKQMAGNCKCLLWLTVIVVVNVGCGDAGRWDRYAGGGSFIGVRPSMAPDGSSIIYSSPATGHGDIYRIDPDGSHRVRLTSDAGYEGSPAFSFDGRRICFMREENGNGHIWTMDRDGGNLKQVTTALESDEDPSFSHDGSRIVFCRRYRAPFQGFPASRAEICVINVDGTNEQRLTNNDMPTGSPCLRETIVV